MQHNPDFPRVQTSHAIMKPTADSGQSQLSELNSSLRSNRLHRALLSPTTAIGGKKKIVFEEGRDPSIGVAVLGGNKISLKQQQKIARRRQAQSDAVPDDVSQFQMIPSQAKRPPTRQVAAFPRDLHSPSPPANSLNSAVTPRDRGSLERSSSERKALWRSNSFSSHDQWPDQQDLLTRVDRKRREYKGGNIMARGGKPLPPKSLKLLQSGYPSAAEQKVGEALAAILRCALFLIECMFSLCKGVQES